MSENAFAGDLLSNLAANPDLLKNAMQMASALASSGMLNGLFGGASPSQETQGTAPMGAATGAAASAPTSANPSSGGFADLLAGLLGQSGSAFAESSARTAQNAAPAENSADSGKSSTVFAENHGQERKKVPAPSHNDRIHLLQSICPFLPDEKREKVQFLIKLLGLLSAAEQMGLGKLF